MISFDKILDVSNGQSKQFLVLSKHFFNRLFQNDVVSFEEQMWEKVIAVIAILTVFIGHFSNTLLLKYLFVPDNETSWVEKCYFIFFFMVIIGFITILEWDNLFPDKRDYSNLTPLPIKLRTLFMAKFTSLFIFVGIFAVSANSLATFVFWIYLPQWKSKSLVYGIRFILVHIISVFASSCFILFAVMFLIGVLMIVFKHKIFSLISTYIRAILMISLIFMMIFFLTESVSIPESFSSFPSLKENNSLFLYLFPPMWFTGLYETLLGTSDPLFFTLAKISILAIIVLSLSFFVFAEIGYRHQISRMQEVKRKPIHLLKLKEFLLSNLNLIFLRNPVQRATFYFFGKTLRRSNLHKMRLVAYMAVSIGLILIIVAYRGINPENLYVINKTLLSVPLILSIFLLVGLRNIVNIPFELNSNWIFKLTEIKNKKHYFSGFRKGIFSFVLLPLFTMLFILYSILWGWESALFHCLYGLAISILLMELLFMNYRKIPFTCSYLPGKAKIQYLFPIYLFSFICYIYLMSYLEYMLFKEPSNFYIFYGAIFIFFIAIKIYQNYFLHPKSEIIYEEEPEPVLITLTHST